MPLSACRATTCHLCPGGWEGASLPRHLTSGITEGEQGFLGAGFSEMRTAGRRGWLAFPRAKAWLV